MLSLYAAQEANRCLDKSSLGGVVKAHAWLSGCQREWEEGKELFQDGWPNKQRNDKENERKKGSRDKYMFLLYFYSLHYYGYPHPHHFAHLSSALISPTRQLCSGHHHPVVCVYGLFIYVLWLITLPSFIQFHLFPPHPNSCQSVLCIHAIGSILFIRFYI